MTINFNAHLGALSGLLGHLLSQPASEWRDTTVKKIRSTAEIYSERKFLALFTETLWLNPELALITEKPDCEIKCESITKALLMILISAQDKTPEQIQTTMFHVWKEYVGRVIGTNNCVKEWFGLENDEEFNSEVEFPDFETVYSHGYTVSETKNEITKAIKNHKIERPETIDVKMDKVKLSKQFNGGSVGNLTFKGLSVFTNSIGYKVSDEDLFRFVVHCIIHTGSIARGENPVLDYEKSRDWVINELLGLKINRLREAKISEYKTKASEQYFGTFVSEHQTVLPMDKSTIIQEAVAKGIDVTEETFDSVYTFNPNNMLLQNACMAKECPYYLHPRKDFSSHIERMKADPSFVQSFHRTVFEFKDRPVNTIIKNISTGISRPVKYKNIPISSKITLEIEQDIELNKDIYQTIYG